MKVLELKGYKSLRAYNVFSTLMLGLKMIPDYMHLSYEEFLGSIDQMNEDDQRKMLKKAAMFVNLEKEEIEAIICFATDKHGVPYSSENIRNLTPDKLIEAIVEVCMQVSKIKVDFVSEDEKKKLKNLFG